MNIIATILSPISRHDCTHIRSPQTSASALWRPPRLPCEYWPVGWCCAHLCLSPRWWSRSIAWRSPIFPWLSICYRLPAHLSSPSPAVFAPSPTRGSQGTGRCLSWDIFQSSRATFRCSLCSLEIHPTISHSICDCSLRSFQVRPISSWSKFHWGSASLIMCTALFLHLASLLLAILVGLSLQPRCAKTQSFIEGKRIGYLYPSLVRQSPILSSSFYPIFSLFDYNPHSKSFHHRLALHFYVLPDSIVSVRNDLFS